MFKKALKYYHTIKYLKFTQIYGQLTYRYKKPKANLAAPPTQRQLTTTWTSPITKFAKLTSPQVFSCLNQERDISSPTIWSDKSIDKIWLYNLHYFDVLNSEKISENWLQDFIARWIQENTPTQGCGWEPYPTSLRIVNWIKWILAGNSPPEEMIHSLAIQTRYLSKRIETHILGNHILANAKALLFAGLFFSGEEADKWFQTGLKIFKHQLSEQILSDGGHFELSPMYHAIILEDLLDIINLFASYDYPVSHEWLSTCHSMFHWLRLMCHHDGDIAFFNDAALNIAPTLQELESYQSRLNLAVEKQNIQPLTLMPASGYCRIQKDNILMLADVGHVGASYQPGHAHADTFSFELSVGSQRLIVNSGTSCYAENPERLRQRSSKAHNVLVVDDLNSSEVWKSFRVARRATVHDIEAQDDDHLITLQAWHDGYFHTKKVHHTRQWNIKKKELLIEDHIAGTGRHKIEIAFHLHPDVKLKQLLDKSIMLYDQRDNFMAAVQMKLAATIVDSTYHPEFNLSIPNKKIVAQIETKLPATFRTWFKF